MKIKIKEKKSYLEGVCIEDILDSYKTPLYLYSQKKIFDTYKNLKNNYMAISDQLLSKDPNAQLFK